MDTLIWSLITFLIMKINNLQVDLTKIVAKTHSRWYSRACGRPHRQHERLLVEGEQFV